MSGGIGFARDAQAIFERNRGLRSNKAPFQRAEENKFIGKNENTRTYTYESLSQKDLIELRSQLEVKAKKSLLREILLLIVIVTISMGFVVWLFQ